MNNAELEKVREYFNALVLVESAMAGFYALCFEYWPEEELWGNLAIEERRHAETVAAMLAAVEAAPENYSLLRPLNLKAVSIFLEGVKGGGEKVRSASYRKLQAMAVSADLEKSVIEARYDTLLKTEDEVYRMAVEGLQKDTARHASRFAERIATLGIIK
jgi:rubrerythrin